MCNNNLEIRILGCTSLHCQLLTQKNAENNGNMIIKHLSINKTIKDTQLKGTYGIQSFWKLSKWGRNCKTFKLGLRNPENPQTVY